MAGDCHRDGLRLRACCGDGQPFVRFSIRRIFPSNIEERNERNSNKTVKPADETEAIADVIIREKEIAAGK